jgi:hypothetical protein
LLGRDDLVRRPYAQPRAADAKHAVDQPRRLAAVEDLAADLGPVDALEVRDRDMALGIDVMRAWTAATNGSSSTTSHAAPRPTVQCASPPVPAIRCRARTR